MREKFIVYTGAVIAAVGLIAGAMVYARASQASLEEKRSKGEAEAVAEENQKTTVKIARVFYQELTDLLTLPGTVEAYEDINLAAKRPGTVEWIGPREGDTVTKGERLVQIDVEAVRARVEQLRVGHERAQKSFERTQELYDKKVAPIDQLDDVEAVVRQAKAALDAAQVDLNHGALASPIDGVVDRLPLDVGEHVGEGETVMKIVDISRVKVVLDVPEKDILHFNAGESVEVRFSNGESHTFQGTIDFVALTADPATRTYPVKIVIDNGERLLRPGMIVRAVVPRRQIDEAIAIPFFTIVDRSGEKVVFVVEDGQAKQRKIKMGFYQGGQIEIEEGLALGDQLVVVGQRNLIDGESVEVVADLTDLAKRFVEEGRDPSNLPLELLQEAAN